MFINTNEIAKIFEDLNGKLLFTSNCEIKSNEIKKNSREINGSQFNLKYTY